MIEFDQLVSINFQGVVVVFGRAPGSTDIYFNVLAQDVDVDDDSRAWSGFEKLAFSQEVRQVGMGIITFHTATATMQPSTAPFRVVTDQSYISVVQQSLKGSLYVNRFRLLKSNSGTDQKTETYTLSPAWEVRYTRSRKQDIPADQSDTQEYLDPDGLPFLEPSLELAMVDDVRDGQFDVALLPVAGRTTLAWQFFILDRAASAVSLFNFPPTDDGLFDVTGKSISNYKIQPDSSFSITPQGSQTSLVPPGPPRAAVYIKHERVVQPDGTSIGVQRAARVMITLPVMNGSALCTATIDSAVGISGTIAKLSGPIAASSIQPAISDLVFDGVSYLKLAPPASGPNPLAVTGPYAISFLIAPATMGDGLAIIGGEAGNENTAAPFVRIVDGDKLEIGFGNGSSAVRCRTLHQALFSGEWSSIKINYAGEGENPFTMTVNGSLVPLTPCTTTAEPSGAPITLVGAATKGFVGALNSLKIAVGGNDAAVLPCITVDYGVSPPQTPNTASSGVTAQVFGPRNEPSSSPVNLDMSGAFYIDEVGLTYYAGLAGFIKPQAPACLVVCSDGLLHLYYQGDGGLFSVAQFSTEAARATFYANWTTQWGSTSVAERHAPDEFVQATYLGVPTDRWRRMSATVLSSPDNIQAGFLNFVSHRVGTYMNAAKITIGPSGVSPLLCDITVDASTDVGRETWLGLPRNIDQLRLIWNGAGSNDPDSQDVLNQETCYFDYAGTNPAVLAACTDDPDGCYFQFVSVPKYPIEIASVTVASGKTVDFVDVDVEMTAPSNWQPADTIKQSWKDVPADPRSFLNVFAGKLGSYDYPGVATPGTRAYGLEVTVARSDAGIAHVLLFVKDALADFTLAVADGPSAQTCDVTICGVILPGVVRDQNEFAKIINGQSETYGYPSGYKSDIAAKVFALSDGLTAYVVNVSGALKQGGAFCYAGLLRVLFIGDNYGSARISPLAKTAARPFQSASLTFNDRTDQIRGSMMFGVEIVDPPTGGGTGKLSNTSSYSDGFAPLLTPGKNGGWMPVPTEFCVSFNSNYIGFNVNKNFSPSNRLAVSSDMTLQCWLKDRQPGRALTYNVVGNFDHPDLPIQYMVGSIRSPALITALNTFISKSISFQPPNLTLQIYVKLSGSGSAGTLLTVSQTGGSTEFVSLSIDQSRKAVLKFLGGNPLSSASPIAVGVWVCLSATVTDAGSGKVTLGLFVNAGAPVTATAQDTFSGTLGALTVGGVGKALVASLNGVAFWQRALSAVEVQNSAQYGFPDNDPMLGIRWNLIEGAGTSIVNSAATGADYNAVVTNAADPSWDDKGAFDVPYVGRNDLIVASNHILKDWTNIALASRQGHGLKLDGTAKGTVKDGSPFNPNGAFCVEAWINPAALNTRQIIVEKPGSYSLYVNAQGQVVLTVTYSLSEGKSYSKPGQTASISAAIPTGKTSYVVANFETGATTTPPSSSSPVTPTYYINCELYVDGQQKAHSTKSDLTIAATIENTTSSFFLGVSGDATFNFAGLISHVRVWSSTRDASEIARTFDLHLTPQRLENLVASWDFNEMSGTVASDLTGGNDLQLSSNQLWTIWQDVAQLNLYINGRDSLSRRIPNQDGYQDTQFVIGGMLKGGALTLPYAGEINDVRLFSTLLTEQQVRESMNKALTGSEDHLAAYWRMDSGSGATLFDTTGMGNNGALLPASSPPVWQPSTAPIQNEGQWVVNAIGGQANYLVAAIAGQPSVVEYAAVETDAYGQTFSVMKRGYFYRAATGKTELQVAYKVGDLDTIFVGQIQSKPTVIGYIEGGPPIPSENQTLAYWYGSQGGPAGSYESACSVTYQESETKTWSFSANQNSTFKGAINIKGGFSQATKDGVSVGLGAEVNAQMLEEKVKAGVKTTISGSVGGENSVNQRNASSTSLTTSMSPAGTWEAVDKILNPTVGRRYIQNNVGIALVKSATADMFMLALKGTQTPVGYTIVPNETIPIDTNIIDFPINPKYVKNGTLDGKVGLMNDPDYPGANEERGSYFKPLDAYATRRKIEQQDQQLKAYYDQFDMDQYRVGSLDRFKDQLKENPSYDFGNSRNLRSIYCNYVWTAAGGLHREEHTLANSYSETYVDASMIEVAAGLEWAGEATTPFGGFYVEADTTQGNTFTMTATSSEATDVGFSLLCNVSPTAFLAAPITAVDSSGQPVLLGYGTSAAPGKVDAYRYTSFMLAPHKDNFTALKQVVDPNWLINSTSAAANAMREAFATNSEPWRVMYRTTYVSRIPAEFQPVLDDTNAPNIVPPANLPSNSWLVAIIGELIGKPDPTPLEIGTAIDQVLGDNKGSAGILQDLIPWWADFYIAAQVYGKDEFAELAELRVDLLEYMVSKYQSENYLLG